jgi:hypothetical protein
MEERVVWRLNRVKLWSKFPLQGDARGSRAQTEGAGERHVPWGKKGPGGRKALGEEGPGGRKALGEEDPGGRRPWGKKGYHDSSPSLNKLGPDRQQPIIMDYVEGTHLSDILKKPTVSN